MSILVPRTLRGVEPEIEGSGKERFKRFVGAIQHSVEHRYQKDKALLTAPRAAKYVLLYLNTLPIPQAQAEKKSVIAGDFLKSILRHSIVRNLKNMLDESNGQLDLETLNQCLYSYKTDLNEEEKELVKLTVFRSGEKKIETVDDLEKEEAFTGIFRGAVEDIVSEFFCCVAEERGKRKSLIFERFLDGYISFADDESNLLVDFADPKAGIYVESMSVEMIKAAGGPEGYCARSYILSKMARESERRDPLKTQELAGSEQVKKLSLLFIVASFQGSDTLNKLKASVNEVMGEKTSVTLEEFRNFPDCREDLEFDVTPKEFVDAVQTNFYKKIGQSVDEVDGRFNQLIKSARQALNREPFHGRLN